MSTFGTAVVVRSGEVAVPSTVLGRLLGPLAGDDATGGDAESSGGLWRAGAYLPMTSVEFELDLRGAVAGISSADVLVADDFDDYGALFTSWSVIRSMPRIVYRATIPGFEEGDPARFPDRRGSAATDELAAQWGADPAPLAAIDVDVGSLTDELGVVAGPFPWFDALGVAWPGD